LARKGENVAERDERRGWNIFVVIVQYFCFAFYSSLQGKAAAASGA
jgi:hypothetical protein